MVYITDTDKNLALIDLLIHPSLVKIILCCNQLLYNRGLSFHNSQIRHVCSGGPNISGESKWTRAVQISRESSGRSIRGFASNFLACFLQERETSSFQLISFLFCLSFLAYFWHLTLILQCFATFFASCSKRWSMQDLQVQLPEKKNCN